jgi:hypothetical protein
MADGLAGVASEKQVRMAARLYEMRETARRLLGDGYAAKMKELGDAMKPVSEKTGRPVLSIAIEAAKEADGLSQCYLLAAEVEVSEPGVQAGSSGNDQGA